MARVQMLMHITGGRGDGTEWPHAGGFLDCGEGEARDLVAGGMARWAADGAEPAAGATEPDAAGDASPEPENGSQPRVRDPKEAWEMHAVNLGATPEMVAAMTKSDLIAQYGSA